MPRLLCFLRATIRLIPIHAALVCVAAGVLAACSHPATPPSEVFRGKTVRVVVGFAPGGGYDLQARLLAEFLGRHLPGTPAVVVENQPGASGLIAAAYLQHQARPDGLTIGLLGTSAVTAQALQQSGVQYDLHQLPLIGALASERDYVCYTRREHGVSLSEWQKSDHALLLGTPGRGAGGHVQAAFLATALHLPVRFVTGYRGTAETRLAVDGGEVDVACMALSSYQLTVEPTGRYQPILQTAENARLMSQGVPVANALARDAKDHAMLDLADVLRVTDRFFVAPAAAPADVVAVLRQAFDDTMRDDEFVKAAERARLEVTPITAAEFATRLETALGIAPEQRQALQTLLAAESLP